MTTLARLSGFRRRRRLGALFVALGAVMPVLMAEALHPLPATAQTAFCSTVATTNADPAAYGCWSLPTPLGTVGINSAVLNNGDVLLYGLPEPATGPGSDAQLLDPTTGVVTNVSIPSQLNILCSGISVMPDGRVLTTGGLLYNPSNPYTEGTSGTNNITVFDPTTDTWSSGGALQVPRWYPSNLELADGTTLVAGGQVGTNNYDNSVERYNPATMSSTMLPGSAYFGNYPHLFLLPDGMVAKVGPAAATRIYNPATGGFSGAIASMNYGNREYGGSVLLPGLNEVLAAGGSDTGTKNPTNTAEVLNLSTRKWTYTGSMTYPRINENLVLLPDGTVLSVGGGGGGSLYTNPVTSAELYRPSTGGWTVMASQTAQRTYHSTAVLLPDGRILSAGSDQGTYQNDYEIYSPPYLFQGPRPTISASPPAIPYGSTFTVATPDAANIASVALVRPGADTHAVNMDQRYIGLAFTSGPGALQVTGPADGDIAPPGWYMLFVVSTAGVPSVASWVDVGGPGATPGPATHFAVTMPAQVGQGVATPVTVTALDASGEVASGYRGTATLSSSDPGAALPAPYTFGAGDNGTHTFSVTLQTLGSESVTASDAGPPVISGTTGAMVVGPTTHFAVTGPSTFSPGVPSLVTVTALDASGGVVAGYRGTVQLSSTDPGASLPGPYTFTAADAGSHALSVTLATLGSGTITATDSGPPVLTGSSPTLVVGSASHLAVSVPSSFAPGAPTPVTVTALDANGDVASGYAGTVSLTSSDPAAVLPAPYSFTAADQGVHVFVVTLETQGAGTLTAADAGPPPLVGSAATFVAGTATHFAMYPPKTMVAGTPFRMTLIALDAHNNRVAGYLGTVHFSSSDALATLPADTSFTAADQGRIAVAMTLATAGSQVVAAQDVAQSSVAGQVTVTVGP